MLLQKQTLLFNATPEPLPKISLNQNYNIMVGLRDEEKQVVIEKYCKQHNITKVFIFYPPLFPLETIFEGVNITYTQYMDMFEFKYYYKLLEHITDKTLIVFNECMRNQDRKVITYSAAHDFARNTPHILVFEYFPFIEHEKDFMVLLEFVDPSRYKNKPFTYEYLEEEKIFIRPYKFTLTTIDHMPSKEETEKYKVQKQKAFDELGESDPDIIPRRLHLFAGVLKKYMMVKNRWYIARTKRGAFNVDTYRSMVKDREYVVLDFPCRRLEFNDFLKYTGNTDIVFLNSGLKVDQYYINDFKEWINRLERFYAKASVQ